MFSWSIYTHCQLYNNTRNDHLDVFYPPVEIDVVNIWCAYEIHDVCILGKFLKATFSLRCKFNVVGYREPTYPKTSWQYWKRKLLGEEFKEKEDEEKNKKKKITIDVSVTE